MRKLLEDSEGKLFLLLEPVKNDEPLRIEFQRLRYHEFVLKKNRKWEPENGEMLERDEYDLYADYIICVSGEKYGKKKIIAGCRLITDEKTKLPISKAVEKIQSNSLEISRLISEDPAIKCMLYALIHQYAVGRGYEHIYALARRGIARIVKREKMDIFIKLGEELTRKNLRLVPMMTLISQIPHLAKNESFLIAI